MALEEAAGWNQTEQDWRMFLRLARRGCFALVEKGDVIATATAVPYFDRFGWIGMVLVDPERRRRGHGTRILLHAAGHLEELGLVPALDATPEGKAVYDRLGFGEIERIERWVGIPGPGVESRSRCRPLSRGDLTAIARLDRAVFGADRTALLRELAARAPAALVEMRGDEATGFILGRPGSRFTHLGPCVCREPAAALRLVESALAELRGRRVGLDVPVRSARLREFLAARGFAVERPLIRMARPATGAARGPPPGGDLGRIHAIAGPEWG